MSLTLAVGMIFAGPSEAGANERLADAPALTDKDGKWNENLLADTAEWFNDRFFLRQELISMNNALTAKVFGTSASEDVILGSDGWLYYDSTLDNYTGQNLMSQQEIFAAANNLKLMQEACEAEGKTFAFMIAPNKNSLYGENMPDYGMKATKCDTQNLMNALEEMGVRTVDLYTAFGREEQILYFAHDSHWNSQGAALGADCVNAAFGRSSNYFGRDFSQSQRHDGDLYDMMYPAFTDPETDPVYGGTLEFTYESSATRADSVTLLTAGRGEESLLCYRDSFGILLYPYLADSFGSSRFSRSVTYDVTGDWDYVLVELVERNLSYLITNLPVFMAPERTVSLPEASGMATVEISEPKKPEGTILVEGTLPEDAQGETYVVCGEKTYAATLLRDGGFAAYLPGDAEVSAIVYHAGGELRLLTINQ